jgi:hypothetical protein
MDRGYTIKRMLDSPYVGRTMNSEAVSYRLCLETGKRGSCLRGRFSVYRGASWNNPPIIAALYVRASRICGSTFLSNSSNASISASGPFEPGVWKNRSTTPQRSFHEP